MWPWRCTVFYSMEMKYSVRSMCLLFLVAEEWLAHSLTTMGIHRSCLSSAGKTDNMQAAFAVYTNCYFLTLHVEIEYFIINTYNTTLINYYTKLSFHNSIRIIYFLF